MLNRTKQSQPTKVHHNAHLLTVKTTTTNTRKNVPNARDLYNVDVRLLQLTNPNYSLQEATKNLCAVLK